MKLFKNQCDPYRFFHQLGCTGSVIVQIHTVNVYSKKQAPDRIFCCVISQSRIVLSTQTVVQFPVKHDCVPTIKAQGISLQVPRAGDGYPPECPHWRRSCYRDKKMSKLLFLSKIDIVCLTRIIVKFDL